MINMNLFRFVIVAIYVSLSILSSSGVVTSPNTSSAVSFSTLGNTSSPLQHRLTMEESATFFQIHSSERPDLCIEVFKTLEHVGRLWLQKCKSQSDRGIERQTFGVTNEGKLHPSTMPSSCIFLYNKNNLKYRKNCTSLFHSQKNQFAYNFFDSTIFLMGGVTKVLTVRELQERNGIKLQKGSSSKSQKQHWTLHFERDRILQPATCNPTPTPLLPTPPTSVIINSSTGYQEITSKEEYANYFNIWVLNNNVKGENNDASEHEKVLYQEYLKKYGPIDKMRWLPSVWKAPYPDFWRDAWTRFWVRMVFCYANGTASDKEKRRLNGFRKGLGSVRIIFYDGKELDDDEVRSYISESDRHYVFLVKDKISSGIAPLQEKQFYNCIVNVFGDPDEWQITSSSSPSPSYDSFTSQDELHRCVKLHKRVKDKIVSVDDYFKIYYILRVYGPPRNWRLNTTAPKSTHTPTKPPMPSGKYPSSLTSTSSPSSTPSAFKYKRHHSFMTQEAHQSAVRLYERVKNGPPNPTDDRDLHNNTIKFYGPPEKWRLDTSIPSNKSMKDLFHGMSNFTLDISQWDVSGVTDFSHMLSGATSFNSDLSRWNVSQGEKYNGMFYQTTKFNSDISGWDVSQGKSFARMFSKATSFNSDLSGWDVSKGTSFSSMFDGATNFNQNLCDWDFGGTFVFGRSSTEKFCYGGANCFPSGGCRELL